MARYELLGEGETQSCGFCGVTICADYEDEGYAVVGEAEEPWHKACAEEVGIPVDEDGDHDPEFEYDPNYDGAKDDDNE